MIRSPSSNHIKICGRFAGMAAAERFCNLLMLCTVLPVLFMFLLFLTGFGWCLRQASRARQRKSEIRTQ